MFKFSDGNFFVIKFIKMLPTEEQKELICFKAFPALQPSAQMEKLREKNTFKIIWEKTGQVILFPRDNKLIKTIQE